MAFRGHKNGCCCPTSSSSSQPISCLACEGLSPPSQWMVVITGYTSVIGICDNCENFNGTWFLDFTGVPDPSTGIPPCTWSLTFNPVLNALPCPGCVSDPSQTPNMIKLELHIHQGSPSFDPVYEFRQFISRDFFTTIALFANLTQPQSQLDCNYSGPLISSPGNATNITCPIPFHSDPIACNINFAVSITPVP